MPDSVSRRVSRKPCGGNCRRNGVLPGVLVPALAARAHEDGCGRELVFRLVPQQLSCSGRDYNSPILPRFVLADRQLRSSLVEVANAERCYRSGAQGKLAQRPNERRSLRINVFEELLRCVRSRYRSRRRVAFLIGLSASCHAASVPGLPCARRAPSAALKAAMSRLTVAGERFRVRFSPSLLRLTKAGDASSRSRQASR